MNFEEYQNEAKKTAIYKQEYKVTYPVLGLCGEAGELANKHKKTIRDGKEINIEDAEGELGDILWYVSQVATDMGISLDKVAQKNIAKLRSRQERGVLQGSGDNR
ncbi:MAG: nucleoside triphosphate pyrophosphohydrolase family protein [Candidatus Micrarchaeota archaeon]|nr:nucleoside triphosphate pyrophosphohydrolase family protein [Candidatus Micrarchaeota archaeon]